MNTIVLDASALLALLFAEPGNDQVMEAVEAGACMSAVNYSEVVKKLIEKKSDRHRLTALLNGAGIEIVSFDAEQAEATANLLENTAEHGMSFADRACIALGMVRNAAVYTAERRMDQLGLGVRVRLIRHA